jgi:hypothetical protein
MEMPLPLKKLSPQPTEISQEKIMAQETQQNRGMLTFRVIWLGQLVSTLGPGRGTALAFVIVGLITVLATIAAFANPHLRRVDLEIPDAEVVEREEQEQAAEEAVPTPAD